MSRYVFATAWGGGAVNWSMRHSKVLFVFTTHMVHDGLLIIWMKGVSRSIFITVLGVQVELVDLGKFLTPKGSSEHSRTTQD
eukprot:490343-Pyramimonas_sp.AAC.1